MKATFIDFEDSFTFNLVQELYLAGFEVEVLNWKDFEKLPDSDLLVLGPGPGHPDDYQVIFPLVEEWLKKEKPFFGVCLGHQIYWRLLKEDVFRSREPLHGQRVKLILPESWKSFLGIQDEAWVQRYNSLAVGEGAEIRNPQTENFIQDQEILITRTSHVLTYQFHPESIGTSFRKSFIAAIHSIMG